MMRKVLLFAITYIFLSEAISFTQNTPVETGLQSITIDAIKGQLEFLSSDWMEGRESGERGGYLAADYIASILKLAGVKPGGDYPEVRGGSKPSGNKERTFFQNFYLIKLTPGDEQVLKLRTNEGTNVRTFDFTNNIDFSFRYPDQSEEIEAPVVFAGYGFKNEKLKYDDFSKLDLKGKFMLKISGAPGFAKAKLSQSELFAASRDAESIAKKMGAVGILEFVPNSTLTGNQPRSEFLSMSPAENNPAFSRPWVNYSLPQKDIADNFIRISISGKTANEIFSGTDFNLDEFLKKSESDTYYPLPVIKGKSVYFKTTVKKQTVRVRNVIGVIEGKNPDQIIVLGAHYDHLGAANGYIWNGADDNGSGTVGVLTIAKAIMETNTKPDKTIILALWSAEEEGLLGSKYFVENLTYPLENLRLNVNFDMISRYMSDSEPKKVSMIYTESFPAFRTITEENITRYGIDLNVDFQPSKDPPGGSDHRSFVAAGVPIMRFKPGHREEYHTPADEAGTVNWDIMEKIIKISFANIWFLANNVW